MHPQCIFRETSERKKKTFGIDSVWTNSCSSEQLLGYIAGKLTFSLVPKTQWEQTQSFASKQVWISYLFNFSEHSIQQYKFGDQITHWRQGRRNFGPWNKVLYHIIGHHTGVIRIATVKILIKNIPVYFHLQNSVQLNKSKVYSIIVLLSVKTHSKL